jgi:hypothetical protein
MFLQRNRAEATQEPQGHPIGGGVPLHGEELLGGIAVPVINALLS